MRRITRFLSPSWQNLSNFPPTSSSRRLINSTTEPFTQTLSVPFFVSTYNVFFSSLPVLALGVFDQDVDDKLSVEYPKLYLPGQQGTLFNRKEFLFSVMHGILSSLILFYIPYGTMFHSVRPNGLDAADLQSFGFAVATILVIVVNLQCGLETSYWTGFNHFCINLINSECEEPIAALHQKLTTALSERQKSESDELIVEQLKKLIHNYSAKKSMS